MNQENLNPYFNGGLYTINQEDSESGFHNPANVTHESRQFQETEEIHQRKSVKSNNQNLTHDLSHIAHTMIHSNSNTTLNNINQVFFNNQHFNSPMSKMSIQEQKRILQESHSSKFIPNKENLHHPGLNLGNLSKHLKAFGPNNTASNREIYQKLKTPEYIKNLQNTLGNSDEGFISGNSEVREVDMTEYLKKQLLTEKSQMSSSQPKYENQEYLESHNLQKIIGQFSETTNPDVSGLFENHEAPDQQKFFLGDIKITSATHHVLDQSISSNSSCDSDKRGGMSPESGQAMFSQPVGRQNINFQNPAREEQTTKLQKITEIKSEGKSSFSQEDKRELGPNIEDIATSQISGNITP